MSQRSSPLITQKSQAQNTKEILPLVNKEPQQVPKDAKSEADSKKVRSKSSNERTISKNPISTKFMLVFPLKQWKYEAKDFTTQKVDSRCTLEEINQVFADIYKAADNFKALKTAEKTGLFACFSSGKSSAARKEGLTSYTKVKEVLDSYAPKFMAKGLRFNLNGQSVDWIELHLDYLKPVHTTEATQINTLVNSFVLETGSRRESEDKIKVKPYRENNAYELSVVQQTSTTPFKLSNTTSSSNNENTRPVQSSEQPKEIKLFGESKLSQVNKPENTNTIRTPFKDVMSNTPLENTSNQSSAQKTGYGKRLSHEYFSGEPPKIFGKPRANDMSQYEDLSVIPNNTNKVQAKGNSGWKGAYSQRGADQDENVPDDDGQEIQLQDSEMIHQSSIKRQQLITRI